MLANATYIINREDFDKDVNLITCVYFDLIREECGVYVNYEYKDPDNIKLMSSEQVASLTGKTKTIQYLDFLYFYPFDYTMDQVIDKFKMRLLLS